MKNVLLYLAAVAGLSLILFVVVKVLQGSTDSMFLKVAVSTVVIIAFSAFMDRRRFKK